MAALCKNQKCGRRHDPLKRCDDPLVLALQIDPASPLYSALVVVHKTVTAINKPTRAINRSTKPAINTNRTPNRRDRQAYNAYMRGYMRQRRAKSVTTNT